jgi:hypothetical protein
MCHAHFDVRFQTNRDKTSGGSPQSAVTNLTGCSVGETDERRFSCDGSWSQDFPMFPQPFGNGDAGPLQICIHKQPVVLTTFTSSIYIRLTSFARVCEQEVCIDSLFFPEKLSEIVIVREGQKEKEK